MYITYKEHLLNEWILTCIGVADFNSSYAQLPSIVSFLPNETAKSFVLLSVQEGVTEGTECLSVTLEALDQFVDVPYENSIFSICIQDGDGK